MASCCNFLAGEKMNDPADLGLTIDGGFSDLGAYRLICMRAPGSDRPQE